MPTLNGISPIARPQVSFCVEKPLIPQCASTLGSAAGKPKQSGSMYSSLATPNWARKYLLPYSTCRTSDSALGTLASFSSTDEPHGNHCPLATYSLSFAKSSG